MNSWFDLQRNMLKSWLDMGQSAQSGNPLFNGTHTNGSGSSPWIDLKSWSPWGGLMEQQMQQMQKFWSGGGQAGFNGFDVNAADSARRTAEKMMDSQMAMMKMFANMAQNWTAGTSAGDLSQWQAGLAKQLEEQMVQLRAQWDDAATQIGELTASSNQMWQTYLEQLQQMGMPWFNAWMTNAAQTTAAPGNWGGQMDPTNLMGHFWRAYEETFGKFISSPPLGLNRELNLELTKGFETWLAYRRADSEYQLIVSGGWLQLLDLFGKRLVQMVQEGKLIENPRQLIDLWVEVGDEEFTKLFHGDAYAQAQGALVNSSMAFKRQQRALLEIWLRENDMPTRTDLDEAHRTIYELRKDMKALKKEMRVLQQSLADVSLASAAARLENAPPTKKPKTAAKPSSKAQATGAAAKPKTPTAAKTRANRKSSASASPTAGR
jgi:class III poly(R)-hydroxyalkanoic acid synthase PhaE subunit